MKIKKKLKDLTFEEYKNWKDENCSGEICDSSDNTCEFCPFTSVICNGSDKKIWFNNKDLYSDKFLNQEIEVEVPNILDEKEKQYLQNVIKPFRNRVEYIAKLNETNGYDYISIGVSFRVGISNFNTEHILLPYFERGTMYKNMKVGKKYTLEELGLKEE